MFSTALNSARRRPAGVTSSPRSCKARESSCDAAVVRSAGASKFVEIVDTGRGVAIEDMPRLRDRFFRAAPTDTEGNGLGLAIADAVARRNAMRIDFANRDDRSGLRVTVWVEAYEQKTTTRSPPNAA